MRTVPGGGRAYGYLPGTMIRDLVRQIQENARNRALEITGRDDEALNEQMRQRKQSNKDTEPSKKR